MENPEEEEEEKKKNLEDEIRTAHTYPEHLPIGPLVILKLRKFIFVWAKLCNDQWPEARVGFSLQGL